MRFWRVVMTASMCAMVGCAGRPIDEGQPQVIERGPAPSYEDVAVAVNDRAIALARIRALAALRVRHIDPDGKVEEDQFDVPIRLAQPDRVYMEFQVASVELAVFGCDETEYWWINLRDDRFAWLGTHEKATPDLIAEFALPIHPLDFVQLIGMSTIPEEQGDAAVAWSENGHFLVVETAARFGRKRMMLAPQGGDYDPIRIELFDRDGNLSVSSDLSKYTDFVPKRGTAARRVPSEINFVLASGEATARLRPHYDQPRRKHDNVFDRDGLFKYYRIDPDDIELLDAVRVGGGK